MHNTHLWKAHFHGINSVYGESALEAVMQRAKNAVLTAMLMALLAGIWLVYAWRHPPVKSPKATISLISYTNVSMFNPNTNVFVYPGRGNWIFAVLMLTNSGDVTISYAAWGEEPYGWANVQTDQGTTNGFLAPHFTGGRNLLRPGCTAKLWVFLPTNTMQWQCGFDIETASLRERAIWRLPKSEFLKRVPDPFFYPIRLLPDKTGPSTQVQSDLLDITNTFGMQHDGGLTAKEPP